MTEKAVSRLFTSPSNLSSFYDKTHERGRRILNSRFKVLGSRTSNLPTFGGRSPPYRLKRSAFSVQDARVGWSMPTIGRHGGLPCLEPSLPARRLTGRRERALYEICAGRFHELQRL